MNKRLFLFAALISSQLHSSTENVIETNISTIKSRIIFIPSTPKIALTDEEMQSPEKNKKRNALLFGDLGVVANLKDFLSDQDRIYPNETITTTVISAIANNDLMTLKRATYHLRLKRSLLPPLKNCFPKAYNPTENINNYPLLLLSDFWKSKTFSTSEMQTAYNNNKTDILKYCIKSGVDLDAPNHEGNTVMHFTAIRNHEWLKIFKKSGANINARNKQGKTPLFVAAEDMIHLNHASNITTLETLVLHGADINIKDNKNQSIEDVLLPKYSNSFGIPKVEYTAILKICKNLGTKNHKQ